MDFPQYANKDQEISYWKDLADKYLQEKSDAQQELEDFTEESRQLECELEASLKQSENEIRDLRLTVRNLQAELESSRNKLETFDKENCSLEVNCNALSSEKEKLLIYIRELEQKNDDLERAHRNVTESVATFEDLLNKAYEKNALLENEVGEKENLQVQLQRLRDEARDLKQELKIKVKDGDKNLTNGYSNSYMNLSLDSNRLHCEMETQTVVDNQTTMNTPIKQQLKIDGNSLTSAGRISAMNIVGDLLRKVGFGKLLCPACSRVTCSCNPNSGNNPNCAATPQKNYKRLFIDGRYRPENLAYSTETISDMDERELNSMEFRLIQSTCALRSQSVIENPEIRNGSHKNNIGLKKQEHANGLGYASTLNSFFRSRSNSDLSTGQDASARFQTWLNNLMNKTIKNDEKN